jgi:hypothetical protein
MKLGQTCIVLIFAILNCSPASAQSQKTSWYAFAHEVAQVWFVDTSRLNVKDGVVTIWAASVRDQKANPKPPGSRSTSMLVEISCQAALIRVLYSSHYDEFASLVKRITEPEAPTAIDRNSRLMKALCDEAVHKSVNAELLTPVKDNEFISHAEWWFASQRLARSPKTGVEPPAPFTDNERCNSLLKMAEFAQQSFAPLIKDQPSTRTGNDIVFTLAQPSDPAFTKCEVVRTSGLSYLACVRILQEPGELPVNISDLHRVVPNRRLHDREAAFAGEWARALAFCAKRPNEDRLDSTGRALGYVLNVANELTVKSTGGRVSASLVHEGVDSIYGAPFVSTTRLTMYGESIK